MHRWGDNGRYEGRDEDSLRHNPCAWDCQSAWSPIAWEPVGRNPFPPPITRRIPMAEWSDKGDDLVKASS